MKYFVDFVVRALVEHVDEVDVEEFDEGECVRLVVHVNPADVGKVIGRNGHTIGAIRNLASSAANRLNKRVVIDVDNPTGEILP